VNDKERLDFLFNQKARPMRVGYSVEHNTHTEWVHKFIDTREELDAAIRASKKSRATEAKT
jgi:hypothetical protein